VEDSNRERDKILSTLYTTLFTVR